MDDPTLELRRLAFRKCVPVSATVEITLRCNLRCVHCYNFDRSRPLADERPGVELLPDEVLRVMGELRAAGTLNLAFTGGETLVHPNLLDLVRGARARHFVVTVKTNGTLLTPDMARRLADAGADRVEITLYGAGSATYDAFTHSHGLFERALGGARAALDAGLGVGLSFCVARSTVHDLGRMIEIADELGVPYGVDPQVTARYDGSTSSLDLRVDRAEIERLYRGPLRRLLPEADASPGRPVQCACARSVCAITSRGDVYPCIGAPLVAGNVRERSFAAIWRDSPVLQRIRALTLDDFPACKPCPHRPFCRRNSGVVYTNTGNYTGPEAWTCMEAEVIHRLHDEGIVGTVDAGGALRRHSLDPE